MDAILVQAISVFMAFFAIMNPIASAPVFFSLTSEDDEQTRKEVAFRSIALAFLIVVVFTVGGNLIFQMFGLTLPAFRLAGGILVFFVGFHMLQGGHSTVQRPRKDQVISKEAALSVAVSPLAMPILAGPGTITTAMSFASGGGLMELLVTIVMFGILCLITYWFFIFGNRFVTYIGSYALGVINRMMGLILAVIGTQMVIAGIQGAFPQTA